MRLLARVPVAFALSLLAGCLDEGRKGPPGPNGPDKDPVEAKDMTLEAMLAALPDSQPSWKELQPYLDSAARMPGPAFYKRALAWGEDLRLMPAYPAFSGAFRMYDSLTEEFQGNGSCAIASEVPPWVDAGGNALPRPMEGVYLDRKLRAAAAVLLREKRLGRRIQFINFYPPSQVGPAFATEAEFRAWLRDRFVPEKKAEAEAAERMKAEYYVAWPVEFELFVQKMGGYRAGGFLDRMDKAGIVAFANGLAAEIRDSVKARYKGNLVAHAYNNYYLGEAFWDGLSFAGYDQIHFPVFATCDSASTAEYIDSLSVHYGKVIRNSGNLPYMLAEVGVLRKYVTCAEDFEAAEKGVWQSIFARVAAMSPAPIGLSVDQRHIVTPAARALVREYIRSK